MTSWRSWFNREGRFDPGERRVTIEMLAKAVAPPNRPVETEGEWEAVAARLGTDLPRDYKDIIGRFGTGKLDDFLLVLNPFASNRNLNLLQQVNLQTESLRSIRSRWRDPPLPIFPERGGLLPWAISDNGDLICWLTEGAPEAWRTAILEARGPRFEVYRFGASVLLAKLASGIERSIVFPDDFPSEAPRFVVLGG